MKIELLADYRGVLTDERYYTAGEYTQDNMPESYARVLVAQGRAVLLPPASPAPDYSKMMVKQLKAIADERGIDVHGKRKADLIAALEG